MLFLIKVPKDGCGGECLVASGEGLNWELKVFAPELLAAYAKQPDGAKFENARIFHAAAAVPVNEAVLSSGNPGTPCLRVDTKPIGRDRFCGCVCVLQVIQDESGGVLGYVIALPSGKIQKVANADLLKACAKYKAEGKPFVQNMQFVQGAGVQPFLKNYEGLTVPVYTHARKRVNAEVDRPRNTAEITGQASDSAPPVSEMFSKAQLTVLAYGKNEGLNWKLYADPEYSSARMETIRKVLSANKDPELLLPKELADEPAAYYGSLLCLGCDIRPCYNTAYNKRQAEQVRLGVLRGLDVSQYADPAVNAAEMEERRVRLDCDMWTAGGL